MSKNWDGKSKGSLLGYKIFILSINVFGIGAAYLLLRVVTFYYFLFAAKNRQGIEQFYISGLQFTAAKAGKVARTNFYRFGQTLVDRAVFLMKKGGKFTYDFENEKCLIDIKNQGKGGILLSAHLGNWETAGNLLKERVSSKINVVMLDAEVAAIKKYMDRSTGGSQFNIIPIKDDLSHIVHIKNVLGNNELVAIHADRVMEGSKYFELEFLGRMAKFPAGPFMIASKFKVPVTFVYAVKDSDFHYILSATEPVSDAQEPIALARMYVMTLEKMVRAYPEQWFNYFDFYKQ